MKLIVLFLSYFPCLIGFVLCYGGVNPYQQAQVHLPPPPPPHFYPPHAYGYGKHAYGYGHGGGFGLWSIILGVLGFFFIVFIVILGFGFLSSSSRHITSDTTHAVVKSAAARQTSRPIIVISGNGVTHA